MTPAADTTNESVPEFLRPHFNDIAKSEGLAEDYRIEYDAAAKPGDGFMSDLLAVTLVGPPKAAANAEAASDSPAKADLPVELRVPLVCKLQSRGASRKEQDKHALLFDREVFVYNRVIPMLKRVQRGAGLFENSTTEEGGDTGGFFAVPNCHVAAWDVFGDDSFIIMQDLRAQGFALWPKSKPIEFEHARLFLQQLGRLHGLSFVLRDQRPEVFAEYIGVSNHYKGLIASDSARRMFDATFRRAQRLLESPADRRLMELLRTRWAAIMHERIDVKKMGAWAVFGHSDCWNNNMMFRMENGKPTAMRLLDWQFARPMSPADDFVMYLCSSTEKPLRDQHYDEFLHIYYDSLAAIVRRCGSDPDKLFTFDDFRGTLQTYGDYGVLEAALTVSIMVTDDGVPSADGRTKSDERLEPAEEDGHFVYFTPREEELYRKRLGDVLADARRYKWFSFEEANVEEPSA